MTASFTDKVCIITGAAVGLGRALSEQLAADGARIIMTDIDDGAVQLAAQSLAAHGGKVEAYTVDVTQHLAVEQLVDDTVERYGRLDYLINNAGINTMSDFRDVSRDTWQRMVDVNLWGVIHGTQAAYRVMSRQGSGHIVNIASGLGLVPAPRCVPYATTKFAVYGLSESLRIEAADLGVHVSVACPGWIVTPMTEQGQAVLSANRRQDNDTQRVRILDAARCIPLRFLSAEASAKIILRGVRRKKPRIVFPAYVRWIARLYRMCAPLADPWFRYEMRQFRRLRD